LKTYPLQVVMAELFGLSQPQANHWLGRLLPALRDALDDLGALPQRDGGAFAGAGPGARLIIDATERRRQRPKNPEKQAAHYSGKKKHHSDKNVVIANARSKRVGFLSGTYAGKTHEKKVVDREDISYPPETVLYKDTGFQGYEPVVKETCQAKKKAARRRTHARGKAHESEVGTRSGQSRACAGGRETLPHRERCPTEYQRRRFRFGHG